MNQVQALDVKIVLSGDISLCLRAGNQLVRKRIPFEFEDSSLVTADMLSSAPLLLKQKHLGHKIAELDFYPSSENQERRCIRLVERRSILDKFSEIPENTVLGFCDRQHYYLGILGQNNVCYSCLQNFFRRSLSEAEALSLKSPRAKTSDDILSENLLLDAVLDLVADKASIKSNCLIRHSLNGTKSPVLIVRSSSCKCGGIHE